MKFNAVAVLLLTAGSLTLSACNGEPDSSSSRQAKETTPAASLPIAPSDAAAAPDNSGQLRFTTPEGWQQDPTPRQMREATLLVGQGEKSAEVIVTRLSGNFGDFGANINRWRGQVGLEPLADPSSVQPRIVKTPVGDAKLVKLEGAEKASVIALVQQGDQTWFFRLTGEKTTVIANQAKLEQLLASLSVSK